MVPKMFQENLALLREMFTYSHLRVVKSHWAQWGQGISLMKKSNEELWVNPFGFASAVIHTPSLGSTSTFVKR
jgi:hypothetical protein